MKIRVKNELGNGKEVKLGFSWTFFFWGWFVPLFRGDWKWFFILMGIYVGLTIVTFPYLAPLVSLAFSFFYNKLYAKDLYEKGYRGMTAEENDLFLSYVSS